MVKVRVELVADFGPRKGQVLSGVVVESNYDSLLKVVQNKLQLKKKEAGLVTLCCQDFTGMRVLPQGDLSKILHNGIKVVACHGEPAETCNDSKVLWKLSQKVQKAVEQLSPVQAGRGILSCRGRPNLETLAALQCFKGVTSVVTLLRHDECFVASAPIGQACERLGLRWCHAPLAGPKEMGMTGQSKANLTPEDLESFRKVHVVKEWLQSGEEHVVVHCAAGLHRTGLFLYVLLRELGETPESALKKIQQIRQETFDEFARLRFHTKAEGIFGLVRNGAQSLQESDCSVVHLVSERAFVEEVEEEEDDLDEQDEPEEDKDEQKGDMS